MLPTLLRIGFPLRRIRQFKTLNLPMAHLQWLVKTNHDDRAAINLRTRDLFTISEPSLMSDLRQLRIVDSQRNMV
ncbi:Uncharacterised protein [Vibrio cholerae]|nr:Uncharacterised protein [Vibrio cholerae]